MTIEDLLKSFDIKNFKYLTAVSKDIDKQYRKVIKDILLVAGFNDFKEGENLDDYPLLKHKLLATIKELNDKVMHITNTAIAKGIALSDAKNKAFIKAIAEKGFNIPTSLLNANVSNAFADRYIKGLDLSKKVWNNTKLFGGEMEQSLALAINEGTSAVDVAGKIKEYLNDPDKRFRRIRDAKGDLRLSKNAQNYHPGQGRYRSSFMNAKRLAVTETNMAYRTADHDRWQNMPFVKGIETKLSNNHTLNGKPFHDICDELNGIYPKDFKFVGWHPFCRCRAVPILQTKEEVKKDAERIAKGLKPLGSEDNIKDIPNNFRKWEESNRGRIERAKSMPYFLRDNERLIYGEKGIPNKAYQGLKISQQGNITPKPLTALERAEIRHNARTPEQIADIKKRWEERQLSNPFSEYRKNNAIWDKGDGTLANDTLIETAGKAWRSADYFTKIEVNRYTGCGYLSINEPLQGRLYGRHISKDAFINSVNAVTNYIDKNPLPKDMWFQRGDSDLEAIISRLNFANTKKIEAIKDLKDLEGMIMQEGGFMSTGSRKSSGFNEKVIMNVYAPKDTKAAYVEPVCDLRCGGDLSWNGRKALKEFTDEQETIFQRGTKMRIVKAYEDKGITYIDCEVIGQEVKDLKYVKDSDITGY